jgi:hypothetical protein
MRKGIDITAIPIFVMPKRVFLLVVENLFKANAAIPKTENTKTYHPAVLKIDIRFRRDLSLPVIFV